MRIRLLLLAGLLCASAFSQVVKPNFSGTWKLNTDKSDRDGPADRVYLLTVSQNAKTITVNTKAEGVTNLLDGAWIMDSKPRIEHMDKIYRARKCGWENTTLVFEIQDKDGKKDTSRVVMGVRETWVASPDGKTLTKFRRAASATTGGKVQDQKYVFDKQ